MKKTILVLLISVCSLFGYGQSIQVKGVVSSADDGQPIPGVGVVLKGTTTGITTSIDGAYSLTVPANGTLVFSFVGMKSQEVQVNHRTVINVKLTSSSENIDEVIVVGYGTQKKSVVTGAISTVKASDLENMPTPRVEDALKGRTSGVTVASSSGQPGSDATVSIRGITSINYVSPLYVVDGVPVVVGGIDYLNQSDIESIEVLKDAASAAIYGTQAAGGVILVTTKKGKVGTMKVNYNGYDGTQAPENTLRLVNATQYATLRNESSFAAGRGIIFNNPQSLGAGTNWQKVIFNNNAMVQNHNLSFSGGTDKSTYFASFGYFEQDGIASTAISGYKRFTARLNSAHKMKPWLNFGNNISYSHIKSKGISANDYFGAPLASAVNLDPVTPLVITDANVLATEPYHSHSASLVRDANGNPYGISSYVGQEMSNPAAFAQTQMGNYGWSDNIVGNVYLELTPIKGLRIKTSIGAKLAFWGYASYTPVYFLSNTISNLTQNSYSRTQNRAVDWTWTNTADYNRSFGKHNLNLLIGTEARDESDVNMIGATYLGIPATSFGTASMNFSIPVANRQAWGSENQPYKLSSLFSRLTYDYDGKYMFTGIIRRDGSSHFGSNNVYGYFPSASFGWIASREDFWTKNDAVNLLKIRAGYGVNGNDNLSPFLYTSTIGALGGYAFGNTINSTPLTGYGPGAPANPNLKWEQTSQINFGVDAILFKDFTVTAEVFKKTTTGMLMSVTLPGYVGASASPWGNVASMYNKGIELDLGYNKKFGEISVGIKANGSFIQNKVTNIGSNAYLTNATMQSSAYEVSRKTVGQPVNEFYGFKNAGIFQTQADVNNYVSKSGTMIQPNAKPGDFKWVDTNGDGVITEKDRQYLGNPTPDFTYGITANVAYKGFDLVIFGQGVSGNKIFQQLRRLDIIGANYMNKAMGRWTGKGTSNTFARLSDDDPNNNFSYPSNFYLENGAYFRIKTLQLGYTLPKTLMSKAQIEKCRIYVSGNNLLTLTKYTGFDPEIGGSQGIYSIDRGVYPQARSFMVGIDLTF